MNISKASAVWLFALLLSAVGYTAAQSLFLVSEMSFGHNGRILLDDLSTIPGFTLLGNPTTPDVLSDKIILTPPAPGHQRGAIWSDKQLPYHSWSTDIDFRVTGPERGGGNLNIWLTSEGSYKVATSGIYTVGKWDGLAVVIDQHGGSAGMIRGFLNDGAIDYRSHQAVDSLAFGHCMFPYRNRGSPSQLKIKHSDKNGLRVDIDGRLCFETEKIRIPPGYNFGITSASAENPDSHEIYKMVVMTNNLDETTKDQQLVDQTLKSTEDGERERRSRGGMFQDQSLEKEFEDDIPDSNPDAITSSRAQFADLHNRLQSINHHLSTIFRAVANQGTIGEKRQEELSGQIYELKQVLSKLDAIDSIQNKLISIEKQVSMIKKDFSTQIRNNERAIKGHVSDTHDVLQEVLNATPGYSMLIVIIIGSQAFIAVFYVLYKKRKNTLPKKFL